MFERFSSEARAVVVGAQVEARRLRDERIGTEHLLLGVLADPGTTPARVLAGHGLTHETVFEAIGSRNVALDAGALTTLGIDLDAVRERVEETFGPGALDDRQRRSGRPTGHIPFTPRAKKVLELSLREAVALKSRSIEDGHILLGLLREGGGPGDGGAVNVLHERGIDVPALRDELRLLLNP